MFHFMFTGKRVITRKKINTKHGTILGSPWVFSLFDKKTRQVGVISGLARKTAVRQTKIRTLKLPQTRGITNSQINMHGPETHQTAYAQHVEEDH